MVIVLDNKYQLMITVSFNIHQLIKIKWNHASHCGEMAVIPIRIFNSNFNILIQISMAQIVNKFISEIFTAHTQSLEI